MSQAQQKPKSSGQQINPALKELHALLRLVVDKEASDLFITAGIEPSVKLFGKLVPLRNYKCTAQQTHAFVLSCMDAKQQKEFLENKDCQFSISMPGWGGRFRVSALQQRNQSAMVLRRIPSDIPTLKDLNMPSILGDIIMQKMGLILVVGATGSGKSNTLAAMINHRNENSSGHILTLEDPIEFTHQHKGCLITQREVGMDTETFDEGLKGALRQAPDVILVGEIRTRETMEFALAFAGTGHLALATLHANTSSQALSRIINFFPQERQDQVWDDLAINLRGLIAQQLLKRKDEEGRYAVQEILINTPRLADLIKKGDMQGVQEYLDVSKGDGGVQSFDYALFQMVRDNKISEEEAFRAATSANNLRLMIDLGSGIDLKETLTKKVEGLKLAK